MMVGKKLPGVVLIFTLIIISPILFLLIESFLNEAGEVSFKPLGDLLLTSRQIGLMKNSLILALGTMVLSVLIGVPLAFLVTKTDLPFKAFFNMVYLTPLLLPPYIQAIVWTKFFSFEKTMGIDFWPSGVHFPSLYSIPGGIFVFTLSFFPFVTLITSSGLKSIDHSLEEVSLMSQGLLKTIRGVTLPLVAPHITSGAILVYVFTVINFEVADILRLKVYPIEIFIHFSAYYNERAATLLSLPLIFISILLIWGQMVFMKGKSYVNFQLNLREEGLFPLGRLKAFFSMVALILVVVSAGIPLGVLLKGAGSPENYLKAFLSSKDQIFYSIFISAVSSFLMVIFSFAISYYIERGQGRMRTFLDFLTQTPFGVPSIVLGIGLIRIWNRPHLEWIYGSSVVLVSGYIACYCPFVIKIVSTKMRQINPEFEEAAILSTGSKFKVFRRILFPLSIPGLTAGFLTGFVLSLSNLGTALLVVAPGRSTLPITIYNFMHYGAEDMVFALSLLLILMIAFPLLFLYPGNRMARRLGRT